MQKYGQSDKALAGVILQAPVRVTVSSFLSRQQHSKHNCVVLLPNCYCARHVNSSDEAATSPAALVTTQAHNHVTLPLYMPFCFFCFVQVSDREYLSMFPAWQDKVAAAQQLVQEGRGEDVVYRCVSFEKEGRASLTWGRFIVPQGLVLNHAAVATPCGAPLHMLSFAFLLQLTTACCTLPSICVVWRLCPHSCRVTEWDGAAVTARRLVSLCCKGGDDDMFSTDLSLQELQVGGWQQRQRYSLFLICHCSQG